MSEAWLDPHTGIVYEMGRECLPEHIYERAISCNADLRYKVAEREHIQWAGWMHYLFSKCDFNDQGEAIIPRELVERWRRQMTTDFADLSYQEKQSDYAEADGVLLLINQTEERSSA